MSQAQNPFSPCFSSTDFFLGGGGVFQTGAILRDFFSVLHVLFGRMSKNRIGAPQSPAECWIGYCFHVTLVHATCVQSLHVSATQKHKSTLRLATMLAKIKTSGHDHVCQVSAKPARQCVLFNLKPLSGCSHDAIATSFFDQ